MNLPNLITSLRAVVFGPLACAFLVNNWLVPALVAMLLGELTDFLDGRVARKYNRVSETGKIFDPLCDAVFHTFVWASFLSIGWAPVYLVMIFIIRDQAVSTIRIFLAKGSITLAAKKSGKVKMVTQAIAQTALVVMHMYLPEASLGVAQPVVVWVAAIITAYSLYDYSLSFLQAIREKKIALT